MRDVVGDVHQRFDGEGRCRPRGFHGQGAGGRSLLHVVVKTGHEAIDERTTDRELDAVVMAYAYHLDVFADLRVRPLRLRVVESAFDREHRASEFGERRKPDAADGVVRKRLAAGPDEEPRQVRRSGTQACPRL